MPGTTIKEVDERYAQEVANINQRLDKSERFQLEMTGRIAAIDTNLRWIKGIGAFVGAAIVAFAGSLLYMSNKAGHVEEAVSTLQGETKRVVEAVSTLQGESKRIAEAVSTLQGETKRVAEAVSTVQGQTKFQESQIAKVLSIVERIEGRTVK